MIYSVGSIILVKNQIFEMGREEKHHSVDHAYARPVVVIAEDDEYLYYLTLTSKRGDIKERFEYKKNKNLKYVKIVNIYRKKIYGAEEKERFEDSILLKLLISLYNYQKKDSHEYFKDIELLILKKIKELEIKLNKTDSFINNKSGYKM